MPVINIEFDEKSVSGGDVLLLSKAMHMIVSKATGIDDVPVYANSAKIKVAVAPIEIFVRMSSSKIKDLEALTLLIKKETHDWKEANGFSHKINLTLIPEPWKIEIDI